MASKINLLECIVNEGTQLLQGNAESSQEGGEANLEDVKALLDELKLTHSELFDIPVNVNMISDLHKVSDNIKQTYIRKKERRDSYKERRRSDRTYLGRRHSSLDDNPVITRRHSEGGANFRRRSSGNISDTLQSRTYRNPSSPSYKQQFFEGIPPQISESIKETSHETEKSSRSTQKRYEFKKSNGYRNGLSQAENVRSTIKRQESWGGSTTSDKPKIENWRRKGDTDTSLAPL